MVWQIKLEKSVQEPITDLAYRLGYQWGNRGNAADLIRAIARGDIPVGGQQQVFSFSAQKAILSAATYAFRSGKIVESQQLINLINTKESDPSILAKIDQFLAMTESDRLDKIVGFIEKKTPFILSYESISGNHHEFAISHAQIEFHQEHPFLDCVATSQTKVNEEISGLENNWSFPLDRVSQMSIRPDNSGIWLDAMPSCTVQFELSGIVAKRYQLMPGETDVWIEDRRLISRRITRSYWFLEEMKLYAPKVRIVSPKILETLLQSIAEDWVSYLNL